MPAAVEPSIEARHAREARIKAVQMVVRLTVCNVSEAETLVDLLIKASK